MTHIVKSPISGPANFSKVMSIAADWYEAGGGWSQNHSRSRGAVCIMQCLQDVAARHFDVNCYDYCTLHDIMEDVCGQKPIHWNDAPGRTKAEVIAKLREAASVVSP